MPKKELPKGVALQLIKVGDQEFFSYEGEIKPAGKYMGFPKIKEEAAGDVDIDLIIKPEQVATNANTYQEVATWTVSKRKGYLDNISFDSDTPATAQWKLEIKSSEIFKDKKQQNITDIPVKEIDYAKGDTITLSVKSDGVTNIVADGLIVGREVE